jgi:hypothetical protein
MTLSVMLLNRPLVVASKALNPKLTVLPKMLPPPVTFTTGPRLGAG